MNVFKKVLLAIGLIVFAPALLLGLVLGFFLFAIWVFGFSNAILYLPGMALYVLGFCTPVGLYQWSKRSGGQPSGPFRLPGVAWIAGGALVATGLGQIMLATHTYDFFWLVFVLAAAFPPLTALALASQRLGAVTTWRRIVAGLLAGSLLSPAIALFLTGIVTVLAILLVLPLRELVDRVVASPGLEKLFFSPMLVLILVESAVVAPIVEEAAKPIAVILLAKRLRRPAEAFLVGMAGGLGFAIVENMLYASSGDTEWAHIVALRAIGGAIHPLNAGLVALGWYGVRNGQPGARGKLLGFYGLAVGIHALWNGGLWILYSDLGAYLLGAESWQLNIYGIGQPGVVIVFMLLEAIALWRLLVLVTRNLASEENVVAEPFLALHLEQPRHLALWAGAALFLVVPIAMLYGPLVARYWSIAYPIG